MKFKLFRIILEILTVFNIDYILIYSRLAGREELSPNLALIKKTYLISFKILAKSKIFKLSINSNYGSLI